jgi:hypothetical protein
MDKNDLLEDYSLLKDALYAINVSYDVFLVHIYSQAPMNIDLSNGSDIIISS